MDKTRKSLAYSVVFKAGARLLQIFEEKDKGFFLFEKKNTLILSVNLTNKPKKLSFPKFICIFPMTAFYQRNRRNRKEKSNSGGLSTLWTAPIIFWPDSENGECFWL